MTIPTYPQFVAPLLQYLGEQHGPVRTKDVYEALAERVGLTADDLAELLPSGLQPVYKNRIGWAQDALKRSSLSSAPARGVWLITDSGRQLLKQHGGHLPAEIVERVANSSRNVSLKSLAQNGGEAPVEAATAAAVANNQSPREQIESALAQIRASVANDLLELIGRHSPAEFESLVLDVLYAMGYGMSRDALLRVGRSGDGGIDGIISLDRLGLQKVYVQAKKWQGQVGSPQIQTFLGALQLRGADKGVLITSGTISIPAIEAAKQARGTVVVIDGARLAELMIEHEVGVAREKLMIPKVDTDYFEDE